MKYADTAQRLLNAKPMTRYELECALCTSQQQTNRVLNCLGARVVGFKRAPKQGRPAPVYALGEVEMERCSVSLANLSSIFQLGDRAGA